MTSAPPDRTSAPTMEPSAEERLDACLDNGGNCDQVLGIAAIEKAYRDGWNAALAAQPPSTPPPLSRLWALTRTYFGGDGVLTRADAISIAYELAKEVWNAALAESRAEVARLTAQLKMDQEGGGRARVFIEKKGLWGEFIRWETVGIEEAARLRSSAATGEDREALTLLENITHADGFIRGDAEKTLKAWLAAAHARGVREGIGQASDWHYVQMSICAGRALHDLAAFHRDAARHFDRALAAQAPEPEQNTSSLNLANSSGEASVPLARSLIDLETQDQANVRPVA